MSDAPAQEQGSSGSPKPLSSEEVAAKQAKLAELRALKAERDRQKQQQEQQQQHEQQQQQPQRRVPVMEYGYDDNNYGSGAYVDNSGEWGDSYWPGDAEGGSDADSTGEEDILRAFDDDMAAAAGASAPAANGAAPAMQQGSGSFAAAPSHRRELGDFEILRLAKNGDTASFFDYAAIAAIDVTSFEDNQKRNALHYAADAGSVPLLQKLREAKVPYHDCDKGMTPLDIAVITGQPAEVVEELKAAAAACRHPDGSVGARPFATVHSRFAPRPPGFVMSKPAPSTTTAPLKDAAQRAFWGFADASGAAAALPGAPAMPAGVTVEAASTSTAVRELYLSQRSSCGCSGWLAPLAPSPAAAVLVASKAEGEAVGAVAAAAVGGSIRGAGKLSGLDVAGLSVAGHLVVAEAAQGTGVAAALLGTLASAAPLSAAGAVAFTTPALLSRPPTAAAMAKWFVRAPDAMSVYRSGDRGLVDSVFPDFDRYDEKLRTDNVLLGAVGAEMEKKHAEAIVGWGEVDAGNADHVALVLQFLQQAPAKASSGAAELAYCPATAEDLAAAALLGSGADARAFVRVDAATGAVVDYAAFRLRRSITATEPAPVAVAQVAYAVFTQLKAADKAEHLLLIASRLLQAHVLLVPSLFGFSESDLVKANFKELDKAREFLYVLQRAESGAVASVTGVPAAKVYLPLFVL